MTMSLIIALVMAGAVVALILYDSRPQTRHCPTCHATYHGPLGGATTWILTHDCAPQDTP